MLFGSKKVIGLDIGSNSIKAAELEVGRKGATLVGFAMVPTPPGSIVSGEISDIQGLASAIRSVISKLGTRRKNVAVGLWGTAIIVKKISIPRMEEKLLLEQLRWEAEQYIPFDLNEVNVDYQILKDSSGSGDTIDVILVAAQKGQIGQFVQAIEVSQLKCSIVDISGFALKNCFEFNYRGVADQPVLMIDVGAGVTNFVVGYRGEILFSRDIPVGGVNYTQDISKAMGISLDEAESLKMSYALGQASPEELVNILQQTTEQLVDEIRSSFDFYSSSISGNLQPQLAFITGGGSRLPHLVDSVSKSVGIAVEMFNPFMKVKPSSRKSSSGYLNEVRDFASIAIGLGLRQLGDRVG